MLFWKTLPDALTIIGEFCLVLAVFHMASALLGRGRWVEPVFDRITGVLKKPTEFIDNIWQEM